MRDKAAVVEEGFQRTSELSVSRAGQASSLATERMPVCSIHLYPSGMLHASRINRITTTVGEMGIVDEVMIIGSSEQGLPDYQPLDETKSIARVPKWFANPQNATQRALNVPVWSARVSRSLQKRSIRYVNAHSLTVLPLAVWLKFRHQAVLVYQPHELETETVGNHGLRQFVSKAIERQLIKSCDAVICVSDLIADWYSSTYALNRPAVVRNIPDLAIQERSKSPSILRQAFAIPDTAIVFLYQGGMFYGRRLDQFVRVFQRVKPNRHLIFMGFGERSEFAETVASRCPNIHFFPAVLPHQVLMHTEGADVGLTGVENVCLSYFYSLPNKLFEYLAAGIPFIVPAYPEMTRLIERHDCGWIAGETDDDWVRCIDGVTAEDLEQRKVAAREAALQFSWANEDQVLRNTYRKLHQGVTSGATRQYRICSRCIMDTSDPEITFNAVGICSHCGKYDHRAATELFVDAAGQAERARLVAKIKASGRGRDYDCIIGVSGGVDSTYVAYTAKQLGLRPLAVHLDNGWNSELAVKNIENVLRVLEIDLYTHVVDWDEFKDLHLSFLKASVANSEIPTDHAILAVLYQIASKRNIKYILGGGNITTEGVMPTSWMYDAKDLRHLRAIHRRFGRVPLRTFPSFSLMAFLYWTFVKQIRMIPILNYVTYRRQDAIDLLVKELGWRDYGGKHYESIYTKFFQAHILPTKFGIDKRRPHYSSQVCSGHLSRDEALRALEQPLYSDSALNSDRDYVLKKLGLSRQEFETIMNQPARKYSDYPSNAFVLRRMPMLVKFVKRVATARFARR